MAAQRGMVGLPVAMQVSMTSSPWGPQVVVGTGVSGVLE